MPQKQRQDESQFEELVTDLLKNRMTHMQRMPGGSVSGDDYYAGSHPTNRKLSSKIDDFADDCLDEYSDFNDSSSESTNWEASDEDDITSSDGWVGGKRVTFMIKYACKNLMHSFLYNIILAHCTNIRLCTTKCIATETLY